MTKKRNSDTGTISNLIHPVLLIGLIVQNCSNCSKLFNTDPRQTRPDHTKTDQSRPELNWAELSWTELNWAEVSWTKLNSAKSIWTELNPAELNWTELKWAEPNWTRLNPSELSWFQLNWTELKWTQLNPSELSWIQLNWDKLNWTGSRVPGESQTVPSWSEMVTIAWNGELVQKSTKRSSIVQSIKEAYNWKDYVLKTHGLSAEDAKADVKKRHTFDHPSLLSDPIIFFVLYFFNVQIFSISQSYCLFLWSKSYIIHKKYPKLKLSYQVQSHKRSILKNDIKQTFSQF